MWPVVARGQHKNTRHFIVACFDMTHPNHTPRVDIIYAVYVYRLLPRFAYFISHVFSYASIRDTNNVFCSADNISSFCTRLRIRLHDDVVGRGRVPVSNDCSIFARRSISRVIRAFVTSLSGIDHLPDCGCLRALGNVCPSRHNPPIFRRNSPMYNAAYFASRHIVVSSITVFVILPFFAMSSPRFVLVWGVCGVCHIRLLMCVFGFVMCSRAHALYPQNGSLAILKCESSYSLL